MRGPADMSRFDNRTSRPSTIQRRTAPLVGLPTMLIKDALSILIRQGLQIIPSKHNAATIIAVQLAVFAVDQIQLPDPLVVMDEVTDDAERAVTDLRSILEEHHPLRRVSANPAVHCRRACT